MEIRLDDKKAYHQIPLGKFYVRADSLFLCRKRLKK